MYSSTFMILSFSNVKCITLLSRFFFFSSNSEEITVFFLREDMKLPI